MAHNLCLYFAWAFRQRHCRAGIGTQMRLEVSGLRANYANTNVICSSPKWARDDLAQKAKANKIRKHRMYGPRCAVTLETIAASSRLSTRFLVFLAICIALGKMLSRDSCRKSPCTGIYYNIFVDFMGLCLGVTSECGEGKGKYRVQAMAARLKQRKWKSRGRVFTVAFTATPKNVLWFLR